MNVPASALHAVPVVWSSISDFGLKEMWRTSSNKAALSQSPPQRWGEQHSEMSQHDYLLDCVGIVCVYYVIHFKWFQLDRKALLIFVIKACGSVGLRVWGACIHAHTLLAAGVVWNRNLEWCACLSTCFKRETMSTVNRWEDHCDGSWWVFMDLYNHTGSEKTFIVWTPPQDLGLNDRTVPPHSLPHSSGWGQP